MVKIYPEKLITSSFFTEEPPPKRVLFQLKLLLPFLTILITLAELFIPTVTYSQKLEFSYSYFNITRNVGGGTLEQGDTIEVHALAKVNSTTNNFYYVDTIPTGTQYISGSLKLVTNEGVLFAGSGPYTDVGNDDAGLYYAAIPAVRVNLGTGFTNPKTSNYASTTGGGTVTAGSVPKFYGSTLFIVAYKLVITANNGDTIHPTGNYYFDTSGTNRSFRFNYAGIKIIQNQALCNNFSSASFTADSSFGSGSSQNRALPAIVPGYQKVLIGANAPQDNYYSIANNTSADGTTNNAGPYKPTTNAHRVFGGFWDIIGDHTGASNTALGNLPPAAGQPGGYMLVVNAAFTTGEAYRDTIKNVCPNTYYEFSAWVRNICGVCGIDQNSSATYTPGVSPNLSYTINDVDYFTTGNIPHDNTWQKRGFIYKTGPTETQFRITIKNNAAGGGGNDWVLDDIKLATCYPNLVNSPKDTATSCSGYPLSLSDTVKSYFNNYNNFCWEKSLDGVNWLSTGVCGTKIPVLVNGLWQYVVDTTFTTVKADSGTFYRLKVGTTFPNLSNPSCSVGNSQKIFVKVFNTQCALLDTKLLYFGGSIVSNNGLLKWTSKNEVNLKLYEVEKSKDGINFSPIGIVNGVNDIDGANYIFSDPEEISSMVYYRLKLVSIAGGENRYSKIVLLYNKNAQFKISAVNPFNSNLKLEVFLPEEGNISLNLYDLFGRVVSTKTLQLGKGSSQAYLDGLGKLPTGIYILRTAFNNSIVQNKLFKMQ
ncbi:MAG: T9SS type A sorting domain-containing protein [Ginsengibacter sp.]